jgi:hypothetical protein
MVEQERDSRASDGDHYGERRARFWLLHSRFDAAAGELLRLREREADPAGRARLCKEIIAASLEAMDLVVVGSTHSTACLCQSPVAYPHSPLDSSGGIRPVA